MPHQSPELRKDPDDIDGSAGLRIFFFTVAFACIAGLSFRLYLHPARVKGLLEDALGSKAAEIGLKFQSARLRLAHGALPQLAVEVDGLEANPAHDCRAEPSIRVARMVMPISFTGLLQGRLALGTVTSEDLQIDLDALKTKCPPRAAAPASGGNRPGRGTAAEAAQAAAPIQPWWRAEDLAEAEKILEGVEFSRVTLLFEGATKKVYLESFLLEPGAQAGSLRVETDLRIPPELTYDERLPALKIEGTALPTSADIQVRAALSEGRMDVTGRLAAAPDGLLDADLRASVGDVPLSTLVPLISKAGVIKGDFHPRFMWMNCHASIHGRFQGLFNENPLKLENCHIEGNGAKIDVAEATRRPNGEWGPFTVKMVNVDLGQMMETFDWQGPDGVISDFGRLDGQLEVARDGRAVLNAENRGMQIRFSQHNVRADQRVKSLQAKITWEEAQLSGAVERIELDGGEWSGALEFSFTPKSKDGRAQARFEKLRFNEAVQKVLVGGHLENIEGALDGKFTGGRLSSLKGQLALKDLAGKELRASRVTAQFEPASDPGEFRVQVRAPGCALHRDAEIFSALKPVFFAHEFSEEWVMVDEPLLRLLVAGEGGELRWELAQGRFIDGKVSVQSGGTRNKAGELAGWVKTDFPASRRLKWKFSGPLGDLRWAADSRHLEELLKAGEVTDVSLGLPAAAAGRAGPASAAGKVADKAKENLLKIRDKVLNGAQKIIPAARSGNGKVDNE